MLLWQNPQDFKLNWPGPCDSRCAFKFELETRLAWSLSGHWLASDQRNVSRWLLAVLSECWSRCQTVAGSGADPSACHRPHDKSTPFRFMMTMPVVQFQFFDARCSRKDETLVLALGKRSAFIRALQRACDINGASAHNMCDRPSYVRVLVRARERQRLGGIKAGLVAAAVPIFAEAAVHAVATGAPAAKVVDTWITCTGGNGGTSVLTGRPADL
jgi:hypothetical protein